jgi:hypothetical protein
MRAKVLKFVARRGGMYRRRATKVNACSDSGKNHGETKCNCCVIKRNKELD